MNKRNRYYIFSAIIVGVIVIVLLFRFAHRKSQVPILVQDDEEGYVGSRSCRECHERFYELWSPSHHGKAMQPMADVLNNENLILNQQATQVGNKWYEVSVKRDQLFMIEKANPEDKIVLNTYEAIWALGGRNIYYFLAPFEGGKLQTMPLAYDINRKEWYSNPQSAVRHFVDDVINDEEVEWTHSLYTFNTTCHSCHVSQLNKNYDIESNTYHTTWKEPGINCETCHGPSKDHVDIFRSAKKTGEVPEDMMLIRTSIFTADQHNSSCATCHSKGYPLTKAYMPGEEFFQHFNLVTLENPDFYPDGRDLGENYTMSSWFQSSCGSNSELHCVSCHTSSGRYRFKGKSNEACVQCHEGKVNNFETHTHHKLTDSLSCVSCHMPETEFARMTRSDHSMRPPMPATSIEFESPNACNICHEDKSPQWANDHVIEWHGDYQDETLFNARLIDEGRKGIFTNIGQMLHLISNPEVDIIFRNSMIRILINYPSQEKDTQLLAVIEDASPLIRASAAEGLQYTISNEAKVALLKAAQDSMRVVRNRASVALSSFPQNMFTAEEWKIVENNSQEYIDYIMAYPDSWTANYNLGNFYQQQQMYPQALISYNKAVELEDEAISAMVNASMIHSILGDNKSSEEKLLQALAIDPDNPAANLNYGLLLAELQRFKESVTHLKHALEVDSTLSAAAYNLAVISAQTNINDAVKYSLMAFKITPENLKYGYTHAYYLIQNGETQKAISTTEKVLNSHPGYIDAYLFLGNIYENENNIQAAIDIYEKASKVESLPNQYIQNIQMRIDILKQKN